VGAVLHPTNTPMHKGHESNEKGWFCIPWARAHVTHSTNPCIPGSGRAPSSDRKDNTMEKRERMKKRGMEG